MAISKLPRVNSLFKTTLAQGITSSATAMTLQAVPSGSIDYPNWMVIEPDSANAEIVYLPTAPSGTTYSGIIRGISRTADTDTLGTGIGHAANVDVLLAPTHRHLNDIILALKGTNGTGSNDFRIGDELDSNKTIYAQNADGSKPFVRYDYLQNKWLISNDGVATFDISAGGSGLTRGLGVDIQASSILLDIRTSGGLRNNQGTGSQQADVDPTIVARLDTANTWAAIQSLTAARAQITTDASGSNDAVRYSQMTSLIASSVSAGACTGTSGEAITAGQAVYLKASDGKIWKAVGTSDEPTYSFIGIALTTVGAADLTVSFAPPGHIVTGLAGLTAGSAYYITDTAGTLSTTPGTRYAKVGRALSTTVMQVKEPKHVVSGSFTGNRDTANLIVTTGFRPVRILFFGYFPGQGILAFGDDTGNGVNIPGGTGVSGSGLLAPNGSGGGVSISVASRDATSFTIDFGSNDTTTCTFYYIAFSE